MVQVSINNWGVPFGRAVRFNLFKDYAFGICVSISPSNARHNPIAYFASLTRHNPITYFASLTRHNP